uniref:Uncharacterized protein n=1 Tax=Ananas comosus var. bracteatus TaxID=296719 RepID=A0A6V7NTH6_ANACO|nr:unnamed protein product [Ananas comosus var. bracteatus]
MNCGRLPALVGGGGPSLWVNGNLTLRTRGRLHSFRRGVKTAAFCSASRNAIKRKRERGGYNAGVVAVVCHEVPIDKGTSESSLLGAGSPLPSIPLHSSRRVLYRLRPDTTMERKDFLEKIIIFIFSIFFDPHSFRYSRRILGEAVSGDSPAESRMKGDPHVRFGGRGYPDPTIIMPLQCYLV